MESDRRHGWEPAPAVLTWPPTQSPSPQTVAAIPGEQPVAQSMSGADRLAEERLAALDSIDRADRRVRQRERVTAGLAGGFVFFVSLAAFPAPSAFLLAFATLTGAVAGVIAHALGDHPWVWVLASFVAAAGLSPFVSGPLYVVLMVVLAIGCWATGYLRDPR